MAVLPASLTNWLPDKPSRIAVGMSGGVDSSVVAHLLVEAGHEVIGLTAWTLNGPGSCCNDALVNAGRVCETLGIAFDTIDLRAEFAHYVMDYYNNSYAAGITPNPCVECNRYVKWERFVGYAVETLGVDFVATGHYVNLARRQGEQGDVQVLRAVDPRKDQTYMLARVYEKELRKALFPLGMWQKTDVLAYAREKEIVDYSYKESVDVCFVLDGQANYLKGVLGSKAGAIVHAETGVVLGQHEGHWLFTRGQRKGINVAYNVPLYVIKTDAKTNTVYVGGASLLETYAFKVKQVNWLADPAQHETVMVKVRYAGEPVLATLTLDPETTADCLEPSYAVTLHEPATAVTPGQIAAFYDATNTQLLGGGFIETHLTHRPFDESAQKPLPVMTCELKG
jgi:tRNA-uridine 2-sulfurtransferase